MSSDAAADAAFANMIAAFPNAKVIDADADAAFARMVAASPTARIIENPTTEKLQDTEANADVAFAKMVAAFPNAKVIEKSITTNITSSDNTIPQKTYDADAAFARMAAAFPNAEVIENPESSKGSTKPHSVRSVIGSWRFSSDLSPERLAEIQGMVSMNSLALKHGSISETEELEVTVERALGSGVGSGNGGWVFSSHLSPERLAQFHAMVGLGSNGLKNDQKDVANGMYANSDIDLDDPLNVEAGDAAFQLMLAQNGAGAVELSPGVFSNCSSDI